MQFPMNKTRAQYVSGEKSLTLFALAHKNGNDQARAARNNFTCTKSKDSHQITGCDKDASATKTTLRHHGNHIYHIWIQKGDFYFNQSNVEYPHRDSGVRPSHVNRALHNTHSGTIGQTQ